MLCNQVVEVADAARDFFVCNHAGEVFEVSIVKIRKNAHQPIMYSHCGCLDNGHGAHIFDQLFVNVNIFPEYLPELLHAKGFNDVVVEHITILLPF